MPRESAAFGKEIEKFNLYWMEGPSPAEDQSAMRLLRQHTTVPISLAAQGHINVWAPSFGIQEYLVLGTDECDALFPSDHYCNDGMFHTSDAPVLGVDFDKHEAQRYSYERRYHPIVRLEDETLCNY